MKGKINMSQEDKIADETRNRVKVLAASASKENQTQDIESGLYEIALKYVEERMDAPEGSKASEELEWASKIVEQYEEMKGFVK